jgi:hypothetical protein
MPLRHRRSPGGQSGATTSCRPNDVSVTMTTTSRPNARPIPRTNAPVLKSTDTRQRLSDAGCIGS